MEPVIRCYGARQAVVVPNEFPQEAVQANFCNRGDCLPVKHSAHGFRVDQAFWPIAVIPRQVVQVLRDLSDRERERPGELPVQDQEL